MTAQQLLSVLCPVLLALPALAIPPVESDICIYGGTSAGVAAAVQAARMGKSVVLIEPSRHLGGLTSGGLGMTDAGNKAVIGGLAREFYQRVRKHYEDDAAWTRQKKSEFKFLGETPDALFRFEPHVAEKIFNDLVREAGVKVVFGERLELRHGVQKDNQATVNALVMDSGARFVAKVFIDASYEGDLMSRAGVRYTIGREPNAIFGETLNGVQVARAKSHQFTRPVDPYVKPGDPASGLLPAIEPGPPAADGSGDRRLQAYNFRMCLTDVPENMVPFPKPEGYNPLRYELLARYLTPEWNDLFGNHQAMPNKKTDTNNHGGFGTDNIGMNYGYPEADHAGRERMVREHETYQKGLMWFLANDPRVPAAVRARVGAWGLAKDEFVDNGNWPHQLYIREGRRMISDYVHTEHDCRRTRETPEPVGMGSYNMDSHHCQRYVDAEGHVRNEGDVQVDPGGPYMISYRSIRPRAEDCRNLLVPVCLSCSHIAYGSVRMEPVFMILGQSAATAASLAIDGKIDVQAVSYDRLRERLLADKQILEWRESPAP